MSSDASIAARRLLKLQFASRLAPREKFVWPSSSDLLRAQEHLHADLFHKDAGSTQYQKTFTKVLLGKLEKAVADVPLDDDGEGHEIEGALLEHYASLMAAGPQDEMTQTVTYYYPDIRNDQTDQSEDDLFGGWGKIRLEEDLSAISKGTTGLKTWEASLSLASYLVAHAESIFFPNVQVLELGSGAGLLGALCGQLVQQGKGQVMLTDLDGQVLQRLEKTIDDNCRAPSDKVFVRELDWREIDQKLLAAYKADIVLAADVVYDPDLCEPLACTFKAALEVGSADAYALVASTVRNDQTYSKFLEALAAQGLSVCEQEGGTRPLVDLVTGSLCSGDQGHGFPIFASSHEPLRDGPVRLSRIQIPRGVR